MGKIGRLLAVGALLSVSACGSGGSGGPAPVQNTAAGQGAATSAPTVAHSQPSAPAEKGSVKVTKTGYGIDRAPAGAGGPDYIWVTSTLSNSTANIVAMSVSFSVYDESNKVVGSETAYTIIRANAKGAAGTQVSVPHDTKISKVVATSSVSESEKDSHRSSKFVAKGVHFQPDQYDPKVLGEVASHYTKTVSNVVVDAVCFDKTQKIVGGGETYIDSVGHGQTVGFSVDGLIVTDAPDKCVAYATLSAGSEAS